ncbi:MAG: Fic family protein [Candidatus Babeliales bacterium]|jgi:Fic family protein
MNDLLLKIDQLRDKINRYRPLEGNVLGSLKDYYNVGLTYSSNALEGNSLTETETKIIIEDGLTVSGKPLRDHFEAIGHSEAFTMMFAMAQQKSFSQADIQQLHKLFYHRIDMARAGAYRTEQVFISGSEYALPTPDKVAVLMQQFITDYGMLPDGMHGVEYAALVHKIFVFIHPFVDGNGRVARLLMNLVLLQHGYFVAIIPPVRRRDYIASLEKAHRDDSDFKMFIASMVYETQKDVARLLEGSK